MHHFAKSVNSATLASQGTVHRLGAVLWLAQPERHLAPLTPLPRLLQPGMTHCAMSALYTAYVCTLHTLRGLRSLDTGALDIVLSKSTCMLIDNCDRLARPMLVLELLEKSLQLLLQLLYLL